MRGLVSGLVQWFSGKKTILGGVVVMAAAVAGVWYGKLSADSALIVFGAGLSISGFGAKANRHQAELLAALQGVAQAGADSRAGKPIGEDLRAVAGSLAPMAIGEAAQIGGASLHISAPTADEVAKLASQVFNPQTAPPPGFPSTLGSVLAQERTK